MIKQKFDREEATKASWFITAIYIGDDNDAYNILLTDSEAELFGHKFLSVCCAIFEDNLNKLDDTYIISKHRAGVYYSNKEIPETTYVSLEDRLLIINTLKACIPPDGSRTFDTLNVERELIEQITNKGGRMEFIKGQTIKVKNNNDTEWQARIFKDKDERGFWCYDHYWPRLARCYDQAQPIEEILTPKFKVSDKIKITKTGKNSKEFFSVNEIGTIIDISSDDNSILVNFGVDREWAVDNTVDEVSGDYAQYELYTDNWRKDSIFCDCELCKSLNKAK